MKIVANPLLGDRGFFLRCIFHFFIAGHQLFVPANLVPVFFMHKQHPKTFAFVPVKMLMMHLMRPADGTDIGAVAAGEPFETLMNDNIMHQEIAKAIGHDAKADGLYPPHMTECANINQQDAGYSKDDEERIILFKKTWFCLVMILVQVPEKPMHDITMGQPGNSFHHQKGKK